MLVWLVCVMFSQVACMSLSTTLPLADVLRTASTAARAAGKLMRTQIGAEIVATKAGSKDLLTAVDKECETRGIRTPSLSIWSEDPTPAPLEPRSEGWAFESLSPQARRLSLRSCPRRSQRTPF